jgi:phosphotransferase system HPr (HPr) family protein
LIDFKVLSRKVTLVNPLGLHARPAAIIAKIARTAEKTIWLGDRNYKADAASVIDILSISGTMGKTFVLEAESELDLPLLDRIEAAFENGFGELTDG